MCPFFFHCQSPVTILCPSVRLLQKSSTMDINSISCRWKPDSLFHQSCQCAMSWEPCKQVIYHYYLLQWLRTWLYFVESHLWDFLSLFFISCCLNSKFQRLILQNGCSTKWATCKLTWNLVLSCCSHLRAVCVFSVTFVWQVEHTPTVNISGFKRVGRGALGRGVGPDLTLSEGDGFPSSKTFPFFVCGLLASRRKPHLCSL